MQSGANVTLVNQGNASFNGSSSRTGSLTFAGNYDTSGTTYSLDTVAVNDGVTLTVDEDTEANTFNVGQGTSGIVNHTANTVSVTDLNINAGAAYNLNGSGDIDATNMAIGAGSSLNVNQTGNTTIASTISGAGAITKAGAGTLTLSGTNTFSGGAAVAGGTLSLQSNTAAGSGSITTTDSVIDYANGVDITNPIILNSNTTQLQVLTGSATQSGIISETGGSRPIKKIGAGKLILSGANTYAGETHVSAGTLELGHASGLGTGGNLRINGILDLGGFTVTKNSIIIQNGTTQNGTFNQTNNTQIQNATVNTIMSGVGGIISIGAGTSTLSAANTYTGNTQFNAGTIKVSADNNLGDTSSDLIFDGGALQTTATFATSRATTLNAGGGNNIDP